MEQNMKQWSADFLAAEVKRPLPILSFPAIQLAGIDVIGMISDSDQQARCMQLVAERCPTAASVSMMDLSVEAEAFGAEIRLSSDEVPTVIGRIVEDGAQAEALRVPQVGAGRTGRYIEAIGKAKALITDRPVLAGVIGPFSLAGRLMDMTEIMLKCYDEPEVTHAVLDKVTEFSIAYIKAYRDIGADGVVIAEPAAGLLSPRLNAEFSTPYVRRIAEAVRGDDFLVVYHNCGNSIVLADSIFSNGADMYHFGNAISMEKMLAIAPKDVVVMGNIDPSSQFRNGTPESIYRATTDLLKVCSSHNNWALSSGCDIPPLAPWENIDAFFRAHADFYKA